VRSGFVLFKYWFSITEEQNLRFQMRIHDPLKQWTLSPMDLESRPYIQVSRPHPVTLSGHVFANGTVARLNA
jgi:hypothetical protein